MSVTEIKLINQKLDTHIENQKTINESIVKNLDKLSETVSRVQVYEEALNNVREDITDIKQIQMITTDKLNAVSNQTSRNTELRKDQKQIKMFLIGAIITAAVAFAFSVLTGNNVELSEETIKAIRDE
jgi:vacuolar-type H+-ATPase subunit I/STV1